MDSSPNTRDELATWLQAAGAPEQLAQHLVRSARPALVLETTSDSEEAIPLGSSKFGGSPDLPQGQDWPQRDAYANADELAAKFRKSAAHHLAEARKPGYWATPAMAQEFADWDIRRAGAVAQPFPLAFLAQLDLAQLAMEPGFDPILPDHGRLLFFYDYWAEPWHHDPDSRAGFRVFWDLTPVELLVRCPVPLKLNVISSASWTTVFPPARVGAYCVDTFIPRLYYDLAGAGFAGEALQEECEDILSELGDLASGYRHQLAGWPQPQQGGLQETCQLASAGVYCGTSEDYRTPQALALLKGAGEWQLLLQIGPDERLDLFSTGGCLYVMMRERDIRARAFDQAWMAYQNT